MAQSELIRYRMVTIGGSAGSLEAILKIIVGLPTNSGASFVVIVHRKNDNESILADLLGSRTAMKVKEVEDKESILPNTVYIAPSDYHLLVENENTFALDGSEKIHFSRPSIDVTMETVAEIFQGTSIGILLSGANADGAEGLLRIKTAGGHTMVQEPKTAEVDFMPLQAIKLHAASAVLDATAISEQLKRLLEPGKGVMK